jgi:hypothetical protein
MDFKSPASLQKLSDGYVPHLEELQKELFEKAYRAV